MANPSEAEVQAQITAAVELLDEIYNFGSVNAENFVALENVLVQAFEGDYVPDATNALSTIRRGVASAITGANAAALLGPLFLQYAKVLDVPYSDMASIFSELTDDFIANAKDVNSRNFTFAATPTAGGGNTGDGVLNRLTIDEEALKIENTIAEAKQAECTRDQRSGATIHEESFLIRGARAERDLLELTGSGKSGALIALSARHSSSYIRNPSFDDVVATALPVITALTGWTVAGSIANLENDATNYYRTFKGASAPASIKFLTNERIYQPLTELDATFPANAPLYVQIAWNRAIDAADGTLTLRWGTNSKAVVLAAQAGWQILRLDLDENLWFDNWNESVPDIEIELSGNAAGSVHVDDVIVAPMTLFDGTWYSLVGGGTPFLRDDIFTWTDTEVGAILQTWFWRAFGLYLPHVNDGTETWADP